MRRAVKELNLETGFIDALYLDVDVLRADQPKRQEGNCFLQM